MNARDRGLLLLSSHLGDPLRKCLTPSQLRALGKRVRMADRPAGDGELDLEDLTALGCSRSFAAQVLELLGQESQLQWYLQLGHKHSCTPLTWLAPEYPSCLHRRLGADAPACLWAKGKLDLLSRPRVSLVGSREMNSANAAFARAVGQEAARQGYVLVSGNARGADRIAQDSCLSAGGSVISVIADRLMDKTPEKAMLYLSEEDLDAPFSAQRALRRNRVIHSLGEITFVAQCTLGKGGTWDGTLQNLKHRWSSVFCFDDGSAAAGELIAMGATPVRIGQLTDFQKLQPSMLNFIDQ